MFRIKWSQLSTRSFHTNRQVCDEWTKSLLRRMKKPELVRLAKDNKLDTSGTKNEIIISLLSHQTAKIVGNSTPTPQSIKESLDKPELIEPDADKEWINAFEMKVAQRGGGKKPFEKQQENPFVSAKPHPMNDNLKPKIVPASISIEKVEPMTTTTTTIEFDDNEEGINKEWVKAFDLKVGSRASKRPSAPTISEPLEEITFDTEKDQPSKSTVSQEPQKDTTEKDHPTTTTKDKQQHNLLTTAIGSGLLIWYFGGSEGFSDIWHIFSS